jgi:hypothetical protein
MADIPKIPRGQIIGQPNGWVAESEADHFMQCPACNGWFDMRDLGAALDHAGHCRTQRGTRRSSPV